MAENSLVSVVLPCLNEEEAIGLCIEKIQKALAQITLAGEIVVCDNGLRQLSHHEKATGDLDRSALGYAAVIMPIN